MSKLSKDVKTTEKSEDRLKKILFKKPLIE